MQQQETARSQSQPRDASPRLTKEQVLGTARRWRRFGEPVPAGASIGADGLPDYGIFGPGSLAWEIILHPTTIFLQTYGQVVMQLRAYKPIAAGIRDRDTITRKALDGTVTIYDFYDRTARNAGMHAPMWLGDTATAEKMSKHLRQIHRKVVGDVIDVSKPELGGYDATSPREAMWAALTEMHPMLRLYETFAFRDGKLPRRLPPEQRDQFMREVAEYLRLVGADEDEIPTSMADLAALYEKYARYFAPSPTARILPEHGGDYRRRVLSTMIKNGNRTHLHALIPSLLLSVVFEIPVAGAMSRKARRSMGYGPITSSAARLSTVLALPLMWMFQQPPFERYALRYMWGPDAVQLIDSARALHRDALDRQPYGHQN